MVALRLLETHSSCASTTICRFVTDITSDVPPMNHIRDEALSLLFGGVNSGNLERGIEY